MSQLSAQMLRVARRHFPQRAVPAPIHTLAMNAGIFRLGGDTEKDIFELALTRGIVTADGFHVRAQQLPGRWAYEYAKSGFASAAFHLRKGAAEFARMLFPLTDVYPIERTSGHEYSLGTLKFSSKRDADAYVDNALAAFEVNSMLRRAFDPSTATTIFGARFAFGGRFVQHSAVEVAAFAEFTETLIARLYGPHYAGWFMQKRSRTRLLRKLTNENPAVGKLVKRMKNIDHKGREWGSAFTPKIRPRSATPWPLTIHNGLLFNDDSQVTSASRFASFFAAEEGDDVAI